MNKQKILEIFEEVLVSWKMAQGCVIAEGDDKYDHGDLENDVNEYRKSFLDALNN